MQYDVNPKCIKLICESFLFTVVFEPNGQTEFCTEKRSGLIPTNNKFQVIIHQLTSPCFKTHLTICSDFQSYYSNGLNGGKCIYYISLGHEKGLEIWGIFLVFNADIFEVLHLLLRTLGDFRPKN